MMNDECGMQITHDENLSHGVCLTPPGPAGIAVVRLTGPLVGAFLSDHFSRKAVPGRCVHGQLSDRGVVIDDPVVVLAKDRFLADLNLHGGPWIVRRVIEMAARAGFETEQTVRLPLPKCAVDGDTELAREIYAWLPLARTELAIRVLLAQEQSWADFLDRLPNDRTADLPRTRQMIRGILDDRSLGHLLGLPRVAIIGPANVGKSTLANQLFAQERSITADLPGTTRDWVGEIANVNGLAIMLLDTPGLRMTDDLIECAAIERSRQEIGSAHLVVLVLDASRPLGDEENGLLSEFPGALLVANKADRQWGWDTSGRGAICTVATTGEGLDTLRQAIVGRFGCDRCDLSRPRWWTDRQWAILEEAQDDPSKLDRLTQGH